jgi:tRNA threonylcarbamoyladenosine biosynthesis protein TsaE
MSVQDMGYTEIEHGDVSAVTFMSDSEERTMDIGAALGRTAVAGLMVLLTGDLGSGKTVFAKGIARGLGIDPAEVVSPTYVLCREYTGRLPLYHFDLYRLSSADEVCEIGWQEYAEGRGVAVVEWPERLDDLTPVDALTVTMVKEGEHTRRIFLRAGGEGSGFCLDRLGRAIGGMTD